MSFILDALRKSEHARQKQTGPGFAEVPVVVARPRTNVWATAAVALLVVNLLAVGVLLLRRAGNDDGGASGTTTTPAAAAAPDVPTGPPTEAPAATASTTTAPGSAGPTLAPPSAVTQSAPPRSREPESGRNPLAEEVGEGVPGVEPSFSAAAASVPAGPPAVTRQPSAAARRGSVVYAPIPEASDLPYASPPAESSGETAPRASDALPSAEEITARGGLPELHLDLHVYSTVPQQRFIFVNSRKYREGDALQEGPVIEQITSNGAVLNYRGSRFQLSND